jgi:hypothetical protein
MRQQQLEEKGVTLINSERVTLELLLVSYLLLFMNIDSFIPSAYLWIVLSILTGISTYVLVRKMQYSAGLGIGLSLLLLLPLLLAGLPVFVAIGVSGYSFWRIHENFLKSKVMGWPFLIANTIVFVVFYLFTKPFYVNDNPIELMKKFVILYAVITIVYFFIRFLVTSLHGHSLNGFRFLESGKVFAALIGIAILTYTVVYFLFTPVRNGIIAVVGFLFGGIFMFILKIITPALDAMIAYLDSKREEYEKGIDDDVIVSDFDMQGEVEVFGNTIRDAGPLITLIAIIGLLVLFVLVWRRKSSVSTSEGSNFTFKTSHRNKKEKATKRIYDYSETVGEIRNAFKSFEELAQISKVPRLQGETVKEWFTRMGWTIDDKLFAVYDQARYGSVNIAELDRRNFIETLEEIKRNFFL